MLFLLIISSPFNCNDVFCVIHCAAYKSVNESIEKPLKYYENNISHTINLLNTMEKHNIKKLIFSSSSTVYGNNKAPFEELNETGKNIKNPYGKTKFFTEEILKDLLDWKIISLRYFNPIGSNESGLIGDKPLYIPNNIIPSIIKVAKMEEKHLKIFGNNYNTPDGTCIRDFIHVVDVALAHVKALDILETGFNAINIGFGSGVSVMELISIFEKVNNIKIPYVIYDRRPGDIDINYSDTSKAKKVLNWKPTKTLEDMCRDAFNIKN